MKPNTDASLTAAPPRKKPRVALAIATVLGVGYIPKAPGTFGSLVGLLVGVVAGVFWIVLGRVLTAHSAPISIWEAFEKGFGIDEPMIAGHPAPWLLLLPSVLAFVATGIMGVWSASRVTKYAGIEDPQYVVIDEVSGQHLTLLLGLAPGLLPASYIFLFPLRLLNWKCLLLGFILFRVFDIWKPYPVRRLEKLPGGWGIMADDWMAGIYAALVLWLALHFGLI